MAQQHPYQRVDSVPEPDPADISSSSNNNDDKNQEQIQVSSSSSTVTTPKLVNNINDEVNAQGVTAPPSLSSYSPMTTTMVSYDQQSQTSPIFYAEPIQDRNLNLNNNNNIITIPSPITSYEASHSNNIYQAPIHNNLSQYNGQLPLISPSLIPPTDNNRIAQYDNLQPPPNYQNQGREPDIKQPSSLSSSHLPSTPHHSTAIEMGIISGDDATKIANTLQTDKSIRMAFVRKVYFLLTAQLAVTIGISLWFMNHTVSTFVLTHSHLLNHKVSVYNSKVVLQAFIITFGVFIALVLFTLQSKIDFSAWGPFLYAGLWAIILAGFIGWLFPFERGYHIAISGITALLFCGYIIYDTYMIFNKLSPEEYVLAAIDLYLDILNLFVAILALLGGADGGN
ncbi:1042_t:CDS:2 [Ambispora gerdemannii]|uniref:1042_t:CDS:1 n=1 Tax=Ambispora gerdemannii TaxID=144530 RepID=A0A9N9DB27_9GLOM|nr:1042_t:CDS:2 [Ambispora gerdemannii]